eukprot:6744201-Prymnesium_polylepis.1
MLRALRHTHGPAPPTIASHRPSPMNRRPLRASRADSLPHHPPISARWDKPRRSVRYPTNERVSHKMKFLFVSLRYITVRTASRHRRLMS